MVGAIVAWGIAGLVVVSVFFGWVVGWSRKRKDTGLRTGLLENERMEREAELQRGQLQAADKVQQLFSP